MCLLQYNVHGAANYFFSPASFIKKPYRVWRSYRPPPDPLLCRHMSNQWESQAQLQGHNPQLPYHPCTWEGVWNAEPCQRCASQKLNPGPCSVWWVFCPRITLLPLIWLSSMGALHRMVWVTHPSLLTSLAYSSRQVSTGSLSWPSAMASWQSSNE